jgi:hypothetical protein
MEAHQHLAQPLSTTCCRSLRVDVRNADTVSGAIHIEVLLRNFRFKSRPGEAPSAALSLGTQVLRSSTITPMPLKRPPLDDSVTFPIPAVAHGRTFNEVIVRIKPDRTRSLAGAQVAIRDLALEP